LAYLDRKEENKDAVREFIIQRVNSPKQRVKLAAITALGTLEDTKAIAILETFASAMKDSAERKAAETALTSLRNAKKPADDLRDLRNEVMELQKTSRELKQQVEDLKKKLDATTTPKPDTNKSPKKPLLTKGEKKFL
jgi:HEAT repeat protein